MNAVRKHREKISLAVFFLLRKKRCNLKVVAQLIRQQLYNYKKMVPFFYMLI